MGSPSSHPLISILLARIPGYRAPGCEKNPSPQLSNKRASSGPGATAGRQSPEHLFHRGMRVVVKGQGGRPYNVVEMIPSGRVIVQVADIDLYAAIDRVADRMSRAVARELERRGERYKEVSSGKLSRKGAVPRCTGTPRNPRFNVEKPLLGFCLPFNIQAHCVSLFVLKFEDPSEMNLFKLIC